MMCAQLKAKIRNATIQEGRARQYGRITEAHEYSRIADKARAQLKLKESR